MACPHLSEPLLSPSIERACERRFCLAGWYYGCREGFLSVGESRKKVHIRRMNAAWAPLACFLSDYLWNGCCSVWWACPLME
jgi:hypothetical protein